MNACASPMCETPDAPAVASLELRSTNYRPVVACLACTFGEVAGALKRGAVLVVASLPGTAQSAARQLAEMEQR